jgi:hypothetical protein
MTGGQNQVVVDQHGGTERRAGLAGEWFVAAQAKSDRGGLGIQ